MDSEARRLARVQLAALAAGGCTRFPEPLGARAQTSASAPGSSQPVSATPVAGEARSVGSWEQVLRCQACVLCESRARVVAPDSVRKARFFALADYPDATEEQSTELFQNEATGSVLVRRLFTRLGAVEATHFSYALKCVAPRGIPPRSLALCNPNLDFEVKQADPDVLFALGTRAADALVMLGARPGADFENAEWPEAVMLGRARRVFVLPSFRELQAHPDWRAGVWELLKEFQGR